MATITFEYSANSNWGNGKYNETDKKSTKNLRLDQDIAANFRYFRKITKRS